MIADKDELLLIMNEFQVAGQVLDIRRTDGGTIHESYIVSCLTINGVHTHYILQRINTLVFHDPAALMHNIFQVTTYLNAQKEKYSFKIIPTQTNDLFQQHNGQFWRVYSYIDDSCAFNITNSLSFREAGAALAELHVLIAEMPVADLVATIPDFHNMRARLDQLKKAAEEDPVRRKEKVNTWLEFVEKRRERALDMQLLIDDGIIQTRVAHNDTSINNLLFHVTTGKALCFIDYDTMMPGTYMLDFGDLLRSCLTVRQDIPAQRVIADVVEGYFSDKRIRRVLSKGELAHMYMGVWSIALELGIRFLTDYLLGDRYFRITYDESNADQARDMFRLVAFLEKNKDLFNIIVPQK